MRPSASVIFAIISQSTVIGFATAPPKCPECRSRLGPVTSTSQYARPRKPVVSDGSSAPSILVSLTRITSAFSSSLFSFKKALRLGGWLAVYAPYIDQAEIAYRVAKKLGFRDLTILETLEREMEIRPQGTRPKTRMVGHSGYLVFARKL